MSGWAKMSLAPRLPAETANFLELERLLQRKDLLIQLFNQIMRHIHDSQQAMSAGASREEQVMEPRAADEQDAISEPGSEDTWVMEMEPRAVDEQDANSETDSDGTWP